VNAQLEEDRLLLEPWLYVEEPTIPWSAVIQIVRDAPSLQLELPVDREVLRMGISTARRRSPEAGPLETWRPSRTQKNRRQFLFIYGPGGGKLVEP
jgi:hypothetical protein